MFHKLKLFGLPSLLEIADLAAALRISENSLSYLIKNANHQYKIYYLDKKSGGKREIAQPSRKLKGVQGWILKNILNKLHTSEQSTGFEKGSSILDNAAPHSDSDYLINIDIENFFENVGYGKVFLTFKSAGYNSKISHALSKLCTYQNHLPQGAPSSPKLANLACLILDFRINAYSGARGMTYTRYADDITISCNNAKNQNKAVQTIYKILESHSLPPNKRKTLLSGTYRQKKVTGLVIGSKGIGVGTRKYRNIRSEIHQNHIKKIDTIYSLAGKLSYIKHIDIRRYSKAISYSLSLEKKHNNNIHERLINLLPKPPVKAKASQP